MKRQARKAAFNSAPKPAPAPPPSKGKPGTQAPSGGQGPATPAAAGGAPDGLSVTPDKVLAGMHIPGNQMPAFTNIVKAAIQFCTNPKTHQFVLQSLRGPGPVSQKLAKGVVSLMQILWHQSNNTFPPQMLIPASVYVLVWLAHFLVKSGLVQMDDKDLAQSIQMMMQETAWALQQAQNSGHHPGAPQPGQQPGGPPAGVGGPGASQGPAAGAPPAPGPASPAGGPQPGGGPPGAPGGGQPPPGLMAGGAGAPGG